MSKPITILYGSDTGTAQEYAMFLGKRLLYLGMACTVAALDEYRLRQLVTHTQYLVVVCSTVGQGEVPRNGRRFWKFIMKRKLPPELLTHIAMTTLGVGDSSYPKYNHAARKLHRRLVQLGCSELCDSCEADEQSSAGIDGFYAVWELAVVASLTPRFPTAIPVPPDAVLSPLYPCVFGAANTATGTATGTGTTTAPGTHLGTIVSIERLTNPRHFQDIRHITIKPDAPIDYAPGDVLSVFPANDPHQVQVLLDLQKTWLPLADRPMSVQGNPPRLETPLAPPLTLRALLTHYIDLLAIPTRSFFFSIWHFVDTSTADGKREQEKLQEFCDFDYSQDLYNYANRPRRSVLEFLLEFENNLTIPPQYVFDIFPHIKPRLYLIASSPASGYLQLVVGIVEYKTILHRKRQGLCSKWFKTLRQGDLLPFAVHNQGLKFNLATPLVLIATGTGIAPIKALIDHVIDTAPEIYLFFGFRDENMDYLFKERWAQLQRQGKLHFYPCVSRSSVSPPQYVQNGIYDHKHTVRDLLVSRQGTVYVCGSSGAMPRQVRDTIAEIVGVDYLQQMESSRRYIQETW